MMRRLKFGFTLIELLTVVAITAILLTLITVPIIQSLNATRAAQAFADGQNRARQIAERLSREIGNSVGIRDGSPSDPFVVNGQPTMVPRHAVAVDVPTVNPDGTSQAVDVPTTVTVLLPYSKIDILQPAEGDPTTVNGAYINPDTGRADPTMTSPRGQVVLPVAPGATMVRYWIGRRDPFSPYNEPYSGLLLRQNGRQDNLYVLYRAEVPVLRPDGSVNTSFFFDQSGDNDPATNGPLMDDPFFFDPNVPFPRGGYVAGNAPAKADVVRNWLSRATVQTEISRYDAIQAVYDKASRRVANNAGVPQVLPLVQFRPERISNDPAVGQTAVRLGEETDNPSAVGPDVFTTQFGQWSNAVVRVWPQGFSARDNTRNEYLVGRRDPLAGVVDRAPGFSIYGFDPDVHLDEMLQGVELFDVATYERAVAAGQPYPFTQAVLAAYARSGSTGLPWLDSARLREIFVPFFVSPNRGKLVASFNISEVGLNPVPGENLPEAATGLSQSPTQDDGAGASYAGSGYEINRAFNRAWTEHPELRGNLHRFLDLRTTAQADGSFGPLFPNYLPGSATGFTVFNGTTRESRAKIVAGSEEVFGPDQLPGPNFGQSVRYSRTTREPGPNQYRINYVDQPEPARQSGTGDVIDYSSQFPGFSNPPADYDPTNFVSAVLQPRFRAGYIQFNSDPNAPLPAGRIRVSYRFQFTGGRSGQSLGDAVAVDYDSRQLISVLLTIRNYPQANVLNPQTVTLKATANVRNYVR